MRLFWGAIRAVTVEMLGVIFVVWLLFATAGWTLESAGAQLVDDDARLLGWLHSISQRATAAVTPQENSPQRADYVTDRLDHYSHVYRDAVSRYVREIGRQLTAELPVDKPAAGTHTNKLLAAR